MTEKLRQIHLLSDVATKVSFDDIAYRLTIQEDGVRVAVDEDNFAVVRHKSQSVSVEAGIVEGQVLAVERHGEIDFARHFLVDWEDAMSQPALTFHTPPKEVSRHYARGQSIELGLDQVACYRVVYRDEVEAMFKRTGDARFQFEFSTGFAGDFWKEPDGSYTLRFRGDCLEEPDDVPPSQSKFIISRSKYSGNLLLVFQDDASVYLT